MAKPKIAVYDCATKESTVREMTDAEYAQHLAVIEKQELEAAERAAAEAEAAATRQSAIDKLTALGLTEDEALALVGQ